MKAKHLKRGNKRCLNKDEIQENEILEYTLDKNVKLIFKEYNTKSKTFANVLRVYEGGLVKQINGIQMKYLKRTHEKQTFIQGQQKILEKATKIRTKNYAQ